MTIAECELAFGLWPSLLVKARVIEAPKTKDQRPNTKPLQQFENGNGSKRDENPLARLTLRRPHAAEEPGLHDSGGPIAGAGYRREHGNLSIA